ncbi:MarR family winged helix-turn-helix transcriptional regulator [Celerinatantimonas sp. YJH-8]|uniref:MarR family winged helix-turn-helix transcriptional regulator n=1 Tax=Celerinatantimonas sp. YJH-8 TaxID=3228714 RepID=UPI0038C6A08C
MRANLDHIAFHLMRKLFQEHTASWQTALSTVTKPQYSVMRAIAADPGIKQHGLIEAAVSTKATLAEMLARMEKRNLIYRQQDIEDKRSRCVYLTQAGYALLESITPLANGIDESYLKRLSSSERSEFVRLLHKMIAQEEQGA